MVVLISLSGFAQNYIQYHNLCNEGCQLIQDGLYSDAKEKILDAIDLVDQPLSVDYFNLAKCYSQLNAPEITEYYLKLSLETTLRGTKKYIEHGLWFEPVFGKEKWNEILNADYSKGEPAEFQLMLFDKVDALIKIDRKYMDLYYDSMVVYHPFDSVLLEIYQDSLDLNRAIVLDGLEEIINSYGWPSCQLNGFSGMDYHFVFMVSAEWFFRMEERLIEEIEKGNLYPWAFAEMADRVRGNSGLPCKYNGVFCNPEVTPEIRKNCKEIGVPLGKVKYIRRLN